MEVITVEALRAYQEREHEKDYIIIDVRQRPEYETGHIPGSLLMPLDEFEEKVEELPEKNLIFYCRGGGRSHAAALTADFFNEAGREIYNLQGGIMAWDGVKIEGMPALKVFHLDAQVDEILMDAMNLEKGAFYFYNHVLGNYPDEKLNDVMEKVRDGELGHARLIYSHLKKINDAIPSFEEIYDGLKGDILEGGISLEEMVSSLANRTANLKLDILETAVTMEYRAFDLYRVVSEQAEDEDLKAAFYSLSQAEKKHMSILIKVLEKSL